MAKWINTKLLGYCHMVNSSVNFLSRLSEIELEGNETFAMFNFEKLYHSLSIAPVAITLYRFLLNNLHTEQTNQLFVGNSQLSYATIRSSTLREGVIGKQREYLLEAPSQGN